MLAYRLTLRRWQLYATATLVAFGVQIALALVWRIPHALELGSSIAVPLVVALVYAFVSADAGEPGLSESLVWERFLERAWAVIVLDFLLSYVWGVAIFDSMSSNVLDMLAGLAAFIFSVFFVFADAGAVVDDDVNVWSVIPRSLLRSVAVVWNSTIFARALAIVSFVLLETVAQIALQILLPHFNVTQPLFWAWIPINTVVAVPISALTVVIYRDAAGVLR